MKRLIATAAALAVLAGPAAALADGPAATSSRAVSASGLDLSRATDANVMAMRLDRAALSVCGASEFSARDVQTDVRRSACYRDAMDRALSALSAPAVSAALRGHALARS
ncbi:MAG: UrcA family protein [Caulobacterales bacterium]|nr:UrcA family protein [Caulobacterales bacterium]